MVDHYDDREQTQAKHFLLKQYLQKLVFKWLSRASQLAYVDAFSGPWNARAEDFADTSFMIAIRVLKDAHAHFAAAGTPRTIRCCFVEKDPEAFRQLELAVRQHADPEHGFHIETYQGRFEDVVDKVQALVGTSFSLIFIDPTGWTGYPYKKIAPLLAHVPGEVLVNFMYDFFNRFVASDDPTIVSSFDQILGGPGWKERLDKDIPPGLAAEKLCLAELKRAGGFEHVVSTKIDKTTADRPHFSIAYGTRKRAGLVAFRDVEYAALRGHEKRRAIVRDDRRQQRTGQALLFSTSDTEAEIYIDAIVAGQKALARKWILSALSVGPMNFGDLATAIIEQFTLRLTDTKNLCVEMARAGEITAPWKDEGLPKPQDQHVITRA